MARELVKEIKEMDVNYCDADDMVSVTAYQAKYINQLKKLAQNHPDEVKIVAGENLKTNGGMMVVHLPKKYCKISFGEERKKRELTEEQKAAASERMKKAVEARMAKKKEEDNWL